MSAATIFQILAYTPMPDWLFYQLIASAGPLVILADAALERWRVR